jgi:hypothetical protein
MKKLIAGGMLLALLASGALAQTSPPASDQKLPPGFADMPETKWGSDLPPGLSEGPPQRDWATPPGWTNTNSQGWQNGGGPSSAAAGPSSMAAGKGRGK